MGLSFYLKLRGRVLFFIHGAGCDCWIWEEVTENIWDFSSIALNLSGHGETEGEAFESIEDYAKWLLGVAEEMELMEAVVVGHSMGGAIAQALMAMKPSWLIGGVLVSTGPKLKVNPAIIEGLEKDRKKTVDQIVQWAVARSASSRVREEAREQFMSSIKKTIIADFKACDSFDGERFCKDIDVPVLIICGSEDKMTPVKLSQKLNELIKNSTLKIIEGAGHMLPLEKPKELAKEIVDFVKSLEV